MRQVGPHPTHGERPPGSRHQTEGGGGAGGLDVGRGSQRLAEVLKEGREHQVPTGSSGGDCCHAGLPIRCKLRGACKTAEISCGKHLRNSFV